MESRTLCRAAISAATVVHVVIVVGNLVEDVARILALGALGLYGVALNDEQGFAVVGGNLAGVPRQKVVVGVAAPLSHDFRTVAVAVAVNDGYHAVVACVAAAADVHNGEITVGGYALLGVFPDFQTSGTVGGEMHVAECLAPFHGIAANLAGRCRLAAFCAQTRDAVGVKHAAVGGGKRFVGGRRIFCLHGAVGGVFAALGVIPRYLFKRQAALPQSALVGAKAVPKY